MLKGVSRMITFKQFQKTKRMLSSANDIDYKEIHRITGCEPCKDEPEYLLVYDGECYIVAEKNIDDIWYYYLCLIQEEWVDGDLSKIERILYDNHYKEECGDRECYDCKDEYDTPLVKKGDKTLCEDCINWKNTKEEFANSPFALIVK